MHCMLASNTLEAWTSCWGHVTAHNKVTGINTETRGRNKVFKIFLCMEKSFNFLLRFLRNISHYNLFEQIKISYLFNICICYFIDILSVSSVLCMSTLTLFMYNSLMYNDKNRILCLSLL